MGWSVQVVPTEALPDVDEPISSFCWCPGNMYMCVKELTGTQLNHMTREQAIVALLRVIVELDKGNEGMFSDAYAVDADMKWSNGVESRKEWEKWACIQHFPYADYTTCTGHEMRTRCRDAALRFFLYYKAGYEVRYEF